MLLVAALVVLADGFPAAQAQPPAPAASARAATPASSAGTDRAPAAASSATPSTAAPAARTAAAAEAAAEPEPVDEALLDELYRGGRAALHRRRHEQAAAALFTFLAKAPEIHERWEWAELLLARAFLELGLEQAATEYLLDVVRGQRTPGLLSRAVLELEKLCHGRACDEERILGTLDSLEAGSDLPARANDFIFFSKGLLAYRDGQPAWGAQAFARLGTEGYYAARARLVQAIYLIEQDKVAAARPLLEQIAASPAAPGEDPLLATVRDDARETLARLLYEQGKMAEAAARYAEVEDRERRRASLPLEKAWTHYYLRQASEALGLLHALEAPSFRSAYLPDKYLLRAILLQNLCHFEAAARALGDFHRRYGPSLEVIRRRTDPASDPALLDAALARPAVRKLDELTGRIGREREQALGVRAWRGGPLAAQLERLYDLALARVRDERQRRIGEALEEVMEDLLSTEEQVHLLDYEIGLAANRRIRKSAAAGRAVEEPPRVIPLVASEVYYRPEDEYWNDELHDYTVLIRSKCEEPVPWE